MNKKKYTLASVLAALALSLPLFAGATTLYDGLVVALPNGINLTVSGQATVNSFAVNSDNIALNMSGGQSVTFANSNQYVLTNSLGVATVCGTNSSSVTLTLANGQQAQTVTVTPSTTACGISGGGGGGNGSVSSITISNPSVQSSSGGGGGGGGSLPSPQASASVSSNPSTPATTPASTLGGPASTVANPSSVAQVVSPVFSKNILPGQKGNDVKRLQSLLGVETTGFFGALTRAAVRKFQKQHGILATGGVGPKTRAALKKAFANQTPAPAVQPARSAQPVQSAAPTQSDLQALLATLLAKIHALQSQLTGTH